MYQGYVTVEHKRDRGSDAAVSLYLVNDSRPELEKISCMYCKRTIVDIKGRIDKVVDAPQSADDFGVVVNIRCKLCHQNYRLITNQSFIGVI